MFKNVTLFTLAAFVLTVGVVSAQDWRHGIPWQTPAVVTPGERLGAPPSDAIILFDGTDFSAWDREWLIEGGAMVAPERGNPARRDIRTRQAFGSVQLHLEFASPAEVTGGGQSRGNSGIFFGDNRYEVQILDSFENPTYYDGMCASIYKQMPPFVNASRRPGEWQTLDIIFNRPELRIERGADGARDVVYVIRPAYVTVFHNGVLVVNHFELKGSTFFNRPPVYEAHEPKTPILIQAHGSGGRVKFRNIWVREIPDTNMIPEPNRNPFIQRGNEEIPLPPPNPR